jgi:hypothetical protein
MSKVAEFADMMKDKRWIWSSVDKIIVDSRGAIMSGHHRIMAAMKAGVEIPEGAIFRYVGVTARQVYEWTQVLGE